ncbi:MAG: hypothetical protein ABEJ92_02940 [Halobacteriales archaeon]
MTPASDTRAERLARVLSGLALVSALVAAGWLLWPAALGDAFFAAWVVFAVALTSIGTAATWTRRRPLVWVTALLLVGLAVVGMWSIGFFVAPSALLLLATALVLQLGGVGATPPPPDPPSAREAVGRTLLGVVAIALGGGLAYEGAVVRELFSRACGGETPACALAVTNWDGVGLSVLGLVGIGLGGWLVWRQLAIRLAGGGDQLG